MQHNKVPALAIFLMIKTLFLLLFLLLRPSTFVLFIPFVMFSSFFFSNFFDPRVSRSSSFLIFALRSGEQRERTLSELLSLWSRRRGSLGPIPLVSPPPNRYLLLFNFSFFSFIFFYASFFLLFLGSVGSRPALFSSLDEAPRTAGAPAE